MKGIDDIPNGRQILQDYLNTNPNWTADSIFCPGANDTSPSQFRKAMKFFVLMMEFGTGLNQNAKWIDEIAVYFRRGLFRLEDDGREFHRILQTIESQSP